ncbi:hypothetical protein [Natrinema sp. SYSU A 869]|uniref:DUF7310 family coiled-coil domain-containing protein n=1 Tax=Natrinema sp. SYSU A 869 TaxID=2871694 RepID=UPI001CA3E10E|nr:hypothetical protein [Natrinema sp. SYSU A 869]
MATIDELADIASVADDLEEFTARLDAHERRIADLEGRVDALSGFIGSVKSVNDDIERRADVAVAAVGRLEHRLDELEQAVDGTDVDGLALTPPRDDEGTADDRTDVPGMDMPGANGPATRTDRESTGPSDASITATEPTSGPPLVEHTVSEIVSPTTDGNGDPGESQPNPVADRPPIWTASMAPGSETESSQDVLERRLADSADSGAVDSDSVDRDQSADGTSSSEAAMATDEPREWAHGSDGDDGSTEGVLQSLRARLP